MIVDCCKQQQQKIQRIIETTQRFVNILHDNNLSMDTIWRSVKEVVITTTGKYGCSVHGLKYWMDVTSNVEAVEQKLGITPLKQRLGNLTKETIDTAGRMFIYLNICPPPGYWDNWFNAWNFFYDDLFKTKSLDEIILTLNRLIKSNTQKNYDKIMAQKLLERVSTLFSLMYDRIHDILPNHNSSKDVFSRKISTFETKGRYIIQY